MELRAITEKLSTLNDREKKLLLVSIPVIFLLLYFLFLFLPLERAKEKFVERREQLLKRAASLKEEVEEVALLRQELNPLLRKVERGKGLSAASYVRGVARMVGLKLESVKVMEGESKDGIERDTVTVYFKQVDLNKLSRFVNRLERGSYYSKAVSISLSDYDENGKVSGKLTLYFFRSSQ